MGQEESKLFCATDFKSILPRRHAAKCHLEISGTQTHTGKKKNNVKLGEGPKERSKSNVNIKSNGGYGQ